MPALHDWTLETALFEWKARRLTISLRSRSGTPCALVAEEVTDLRMTGHQPWGPSVSVNQLVGPSDAGAGIQMVTLEMQSGDTITIKAKAFDLPAA